MLSNAMTIFDLITPVVMFIFAGVLIGGAIWAWLKQPPTARHTAFRLILSLWFASEGVLFLRGKQPQYALYVAVAIFVFSFVAIVFMFDREHRANQKTLGPN